MEILINEGMRFGVSTLGIIVFIVGVTSIICFIIGAFKDISDELTLVSLGFALLAIFASTLFTDELYKVPTGKCTYVVEITDEAKYKELVEKGYTFERIYENKEIYSITGGELE